MKAILSDVHSNLEALEAVLDDIAQHPVEAIYCLGDTVGYGPNPCECLDLAMKWQLVLMGNHDQAVLFNPDHFGKVAERAIFWTRDRLEAASQKRETRLDFLGERPQTHREKDFLFVHGSPRNPINEYVFPEDIYNQRKMDRLFALIERYCFQGHTHVPGIFVESETEEPPQFYAPSDVDYCYRLDGRKTMCNVGSVGQPRDGDWRACYVLLDGDLVRFRRIEYDVETTIRKIQDIDDLDDFLGNRLADGR